MVICYICSDDPHFSNKKKTHPKLRWKAVQHVHGLLRMLARRCSRRVGRICGSVTSLERHYRMRTVCPLRIVADRRRDRICRVYCFLQCVQCIYTNYQSKNICQRHYQAKDVIQMEPMHTGLRRVVWSDPPLRCFWNAGRG